MSNGPLDPMLARCTLCGTRPVGHLATIETRPGDRWVLADPLLCRRCHELLAGAGTPLADDELAGRLTAEFERRERSVVVVHLRERITAITALAPATPEIARLTQQGFEPLEMHTGVVDQLGPLWPGRHCVALPDPRPQPWTDGPVWFVRSPWPAISLQRIFVFLWRWVEREPRPDDSSVWTTRVTEVFGWQQSQALAWATLCAEE